MVDNIATDAQAFAKDIVVNDLPSVLLVRICRRKIIIACEGLSACRLENASEWKQAFTDDASRAQTNITLFVLNIKEGSENNVVVL